MEKREKGRERTVLPALDRESNRNDESRRHHITDINTIGRVFQKPIVGDLFGTRDDDSFANSLKYRARVMTKGFSVEAVKKTSDLACMADTKSNVAEEEIFESDSDIDVEFEMLHKMNPKQRVALTIKNWSLIPENDDKLIKEGTAPNLSNYTTTLPILDCTSADSLHRSSGRTKCINTRR